MVLRTEPLHRVWFRGGGGMERKRVHPPPPLAQVPISAGRVEPDIGRGRFYHLQPIGTVGVVGCRRAHLAV